MPSPTPKNKKNLHAAHASRALREQLSSIVPRGTDTQTLLNKVSSSAMWRALRCATATCIPALLGAVTGDSSFGWASLGGFEATLADLGGSYQVRFVAMSLLSLGGAFGLFLGMISSDHLWSVLLCTVIWSFLWSYATVLGGTVNAFNALVVVIFLCGIETHVPSWHQAAHHALYLLGGAAWAMTISLLIWPIHPYRPARVAIAQCYAGLAAFLSSTLQLLGREDSPAKLWHRVARTHQYAMRNSLENARDIIAATRAQQLTENLRGEQLLILLETADVMLGYAIAAAEHAEQIQPNALQRSSMIAFLLQWRDSLQWIRDAAARDTIPSIKARELQREKMRETLAQAKTRGDASISHLAHTAADATDVAIAAVFSARTGQPVSTGSAVPIGPSHQTIVLPSRPMLRTLREAWSWNSATLRHALRVATVCGSAILITALLHLKHGYWIPMTAVIVMRPHLGATWKRSVERTLGSAAGGILAAALVFFMRSKIGLALLLFPMSFAALAALPVSYALYVVFLTPTFVIASLPYAGNWQLAVVRAMDSTLGAALALPAMYGLWPLWQHEGFRQRLADCFQADVDYFATIERRWESASINPVEIARARRQGGLSNNAAEDALDQLLDEPKINLELREAASSFVTYMRRLAQTVTAIHNHPPQRHSAADLNRLSDLGVRLTNIVQGLRTGHIELLAGRPVAAGGTEEATDQLDVLERQVHVLENAAKRLVNASPQQVSAADPAKLS